MRILSGFMPATGGSATIAGYGHFHRLSRRPPPHRLFTGDRTLYSDMSVRGYLDYMGEIAE